MEGTEIVIVGAGPAGLTLGLTLAKHKIRSVILEKELDIGDDPRGVYLAHDAVRIMWDLGIGNRMDEIGHGMSLHPDLEVPHVNFHQSSFANAPFYRIDATVDAAGQTVSNGVLHVQPLLERALRDAIATSEYCTLRCGCTVQTCEKDDDCLVVGYTSSNTPDGGIKCSYLVGADGKRGVVRKHFLETSAGIRQVNASYRYDGTWVAANLRIGLPTPVSHPSFPLWSLGYTPEQVYDLFWPVGWHFACPPGKATATGRFGPYSDRYWRHEFEQGDWHDGMNAEAMFWEHITPMITRSAGEDGTTFPNSPVTYPRDCIDVLRCRPFRFTHKVVNRWFDDRMILIGDAAHVFPPFGGQGIASGVRDAHQLGWRLALLCRLPSMNHELSDHILSAWSDERTRSIVDAATLTRINGELCNGVESLQFKVLRHLDSIVRAISFIPNLPSPVTMQERAGFKAVRNGFFSTSFGGGGKIAQVWIQQNGQRPILSDKILRQEKSVMTLVVVDSMHAMADTLEVARDVVRFSNIDPVVLHVGSLVPVTRDTVDASITAGNTTEKNFLSYHICTADRLKEQGLVAGCDSAEFLRRFAKNTKFVLVRPDMYIYGMAVDRHGLTKCLEELMLRLQL